MLTASRAVAKARQTGTPLPLLPELETLHHGYYKFVFRGSEQTMIVGQPGSQKSGWALWLLSQWAKSGITGLYVSADMAQHTATTRLAAAITGHTTETVSKGLRAGAEDYYADALAELPIRFMFNPNPTFGDILDEVDAWVEVWDEYPQVIILDNLLDIYATSGDNEFTGYKSILLDAKTLARETGACVLILHHASEGASDPTKPPPRKAVMGKVSQTPENVISVAIGDDPTDFKLAVVKQRSGPSDATAQHIEHLRVHPERNRFERFIDIKAPPQVTWREERDD